MNRFKLFFLLVLLSCSAVPKLTVEAADSFNQSDFMNVISNEDVVSHGFVYDGCDPPKMDDAGHYQSGYIFYSSGVARNPSFASTNVFLNSEQGCIYVTQECIDDSDPLKPIYMFKIYIVSDKSPSRQQYLKAYVDGDAKTANIPGAFEDVIGEENGKLGTGFSPVRDSKDTYMFGGYPVKMDKSELGSFTTNLPIFHASDTESIQNYIDTGSIDGAVNSKDMASGNEQYDSSIEPPRGLKADGKFCVFAYAPTSDSYGDGMIYPNNIDFSSNGVHYRWNYPTNASDYKYDVQVSLRSRYRNESNSKWSDWFMFEQQTSYSTQYDLNTGEAVPMDGLIHTESFIRSNFAYICKKIYGEYTPDNYYIVDGFKCRVRHRKGNAYSNWVEITSSTTGSVANIKTPDGENVEDNEYNGTSVDTDTGIAGADGNISIDGFTSYIKSGFGLLGSGGLISLMSGIFLYIPASIWDLIKAGIAATIVIMLFTLIKRAIFG